MNLLEQAKKDLQQLSQAEWSVDLTFQNEDRSQTANVKGLGTSHHLSIDPDTGLPVNVRNTHISISEQVLIDASYTVRNGSGEISLINHFVSFKNSNDSLKNYKINETWPDETLGLIVCILGDYE